MLRRLFIPLLIASLVAGCNEPQKRLNAPPHGEAEKTSDLQGTFVYMTDSALLADMTVNDAHFLPHRPQLTTTGVERLGRLASLMQAYGGSINFNTNLEDGALISARTETIREFLQEAGLTVSSDTIRRDMPGGEGMEATQAIVIRANEGVYKPGQGDAKGKGAGKGGGAGGAGADAGSQSK